MTTFQFDDRYLSIDLYFLITIYPSCYLSTCLKCRHTILIFSKSHCTFFFQFRGHFLPVSLPLGNILLVILMHRVSFPQGFGVRNYLHIAFRLGMANLLTVNLWILRVIFFMCVIIFVLISSLTSSRLSQVPLHLQLQLQRRQNIVELNKILIRTVIPPHAVINRLDRRNLDFIYGDITVGCEVNESLRLLNNLFGEKGGRNG